MSARRWIAMVVLVLAWSHPTRADESGRDSLRGLSRLLITVDPPGPDAVAVMPSAVVKAVVADAINGQINSPVRRLEIVDALPAEGELIVRVDARRVQNLRYAYRIELVLRQPVEITRLALPRFTVVAPTWRSHESGLGVGSSYQIRPGVERQFATRHVRQFVADYLAANGLPAPGPVGPPVVPPPVRWPMTPERLARIKLAMERQLGPLAQGNRGRVTVELHSDGTAVHYKVEIRHSLVVLGVDVLVDQTVSGSFDPDDRESIRRAEVCATFRGNTVCINLGPIAPVILAPVTRPLRTAPAPARRRSAAGSCTRPVDVRVGRVQRHAEVAVDRRRQVAGRHRPRPGSARRPSRVLPITCPCRSPPPASSIDITYGQWLRPSVLPCVPSCGVRPNSPIAITSTSSSRPRCSRSPTSVVIRWSNSGSSGPRPLLMPP